MPQQDRVLQLVCEGVCGAPWTAAYDAAFQKPADVELAVRRARKLVHTTHVELEERGLKGRSVFQCVMCGTKRVFGWPDTGVDNVPEEPEPPGESAPAPAATSGV